MFKVKLSSGGITPSCDYQNVFHGNSVRKRDQKPLIANSFSCIFAGVLNEFCLGRTEAFQYIAKQQIGFILSVFIARTG